MLAAHHVTLIRGDRILLEDLSLALAPGGALMIRGPNGSGKSSLLRLLAGLLEPAEGHVERPDTIGFLGHDAALKPDRTLGSELAFWAGLDGAAAARAGAIAAFRLEPLLGTPCARLSAGQSRRAGLARVMAAGAPLWLLDEPATGLDTQAVGWLAEAVAGHRAAGGAVAATTHTPLGWPAEELVLGA
jgi:heme exporter protein A